MHKIPSIETIANLTERVTKSIVIYQAKKKSCSPVLSLGLTAAGHVVSIFRFTLQLCPPETAGIAERFWALRTLVRRITDVRFSRLMTLSNILPSAIQGSQFDHT